MKFYAPGKLMISGEYVVLDGAKALAIPTPGYGQTIRVSEGESEHLWQSYDSNGPWFQAVFSNDLKQIIKTTNHSQAVVIQRLLQYIQQQKPELFQQGLQFETHMNFNRNWGFGSSSTLIALLSKWSQVPPYDLLDKSFGGSGYDVAVALANRPVLYQLEETSDEEPLYRGKKPVWHPVSFQPDFAGELFLVYLNKKQNSREAIKKYREQKTTAAHISLISRISEALSQVDNLPGFEDLLNQHEQILSGILQRPAVKQNLFPDYPGSIKSLGAWGGDFILATGKEAPAYFKKKGYINILNFKTFEPA